MTRPKTRFLAAAQRITIPVVLLEKVFAKKQIGQSESCIVSPEPCFPSRIVK